MSTDEGVPTGADGLPAPRTRAEARALREAASAEVPMPPVPVPEQPLLLPEAGLPDVGADAASAEPHAHRASSRIAPGDAPPTTEKSVPDAPRRRGRFALALAGVVAVLAVVSGGLAYLGLTQGPRLTEVQVDPEEAVSFSGSRVILSANQPLAEIDPSQVTVTPAVDFTVDAAGRNVGVRFTAPLDDSTEYTVTVAGATGSGGGPASDLTTSFVTPEASLYLLLRSSGEDQIFRANVAGDAVAVFGRERINDFRVAGDRIVAAVEEPDGTRILVASLADGAVLHELPLPGDGEVSAVQVSERGDLVGYVYSDNDLTEHSGRASVLVTQPISGAGEPSIVEVGGEEANIAEWQFVPDSSAVLFIDFSGSLIVADPIRGEVSPMGTAYAIHGVERSTYTAVIQRVEGELVRLNLADGSEEPYPVTDPDYGEPYMVTAFPGGSTQHIIARDIIGMPIGQAIVIVDEEGRAAPLLEVGERDSILQACASPSGQYLAIVVIPDMGSNPYDDMLLPLPERIETHLFDLRTRELMLALSGVGTSWCSHLMAY